MPEQAEAPASASSEENGAQPQDAAPVKRSDEPVEAVDAEALEANSPVSAVEASVLAPTASLAEPPSSPPLATLDPRLSDKKQRPARRERARADTNAPQYGESQQKVWNSFKDSRVRSRLWKQHGVNLIPEVWADLDARVKADRKSSGETDLARPAYIDAIILDAPEDIDEIVELVDLINEELLGVPAGDRTSVSMSPEARTKFLGHLEALADARMKRKGKDLMTALTVRMLRRLDTEGSMPKPQRPRLL
ncbi:hypothetical protein [Streptomyces sp. NPDC007172]|uniref:hypothetical protein n=1 Tax=Streptomyces sp. NPDC007172 TaxID=3364776 RepID=UPI003692F42C